MATDVERSSFSGKQIVFVVATLLLVPAILISAIEVVLRIADYGVSSEFFVPIEGQEAYTTNPNFARQFFPPALVRLPQPIRVAFEKPDSVTRIAVLGGSAAMGEPEPTFSFSRVLDVMLARQFPERTFEVINTGMATINSHVVRLIAEECHKIEPDVVLIYMGNNEVVGPFGAGTVFGAYSPNLTLIRMGIWLRSFRLGQLIEHVARWVSGSDQMVAEGEGMSMFRDQYVHASDPRLERVYSHFGENLTRIIQDLQHQGVRVIVSNVGSNLVDHAPFASVFGDQVGVAGPTAWGKLFAEGVSHAKSGQTPEAIQAFEMANRIDSTYAELHFRLAGLYRNSGRIERARRHWVLARDLDALRFRVDSRLNDVIRTTAENLNVRFLDTVSRLGGSDRSGAGLASDDLFFEHVHLTFRGNYIVASGFVEEVIRLLGLPYRKARQSTRGVDPGGPGGLPSIEDCARDLALSDFDSYRLFASVSGLMNRAPFTNQMDYEAKRKRINQRLNMLRAAGTSRHSLERSFDTYRRALAFRPDDDALRQNFAQLLQETGSLVDAASEWKRLLDRNPDTPTWRLALATALSDQGAHQAALHEYEGLREMMPGLVLPHIQIGYEYVSTGQIGGASHVLLEALTVNPGSIVARLNLIALLEDMEQPDAADKVLDSGLNLVRARSDLHGEAALLVGLGDLLGRREQYADALLNLDQALELYRAEKDFASVGRTLLSKARNRREAGSQDEALKFLVEGRAYAAEYAMRELEAQYVVETALVRADQSDLPAARSLVEASREIFLSLSDVHPAIDRIDRLLIALDSPRRPAHSGEAD